MLLSERSSTEHFMQSLPVPNNGVWSRELAILEEDHQEKALRINGDDSDSSGSASTELSSMFSWRHDVCITFSACAAMLTFK